MEKGSGDDGVLDGIYAALESVAGKLGFRAVVMLEAVVKMRANDWGKRVVHGTFTPDKVEKKEAVEYHQHARAVYRLKRAGVASEEQPQPQPQPPPTRVSGMHSAYAPAAEHVRLNKAKQKMEHFLDLELYRMTHNGDALRRAMDDAGWGAVDELGAMDEMAALQATRAELIGIAMRSNAVEVDDVMRPRKVRAFGARDAFSTLKAMQLRIDELQHKCRMLAKDRRELAQASPEIKAQDKGVDAATADSDYASWNAQQITDWIVALDRERLGKYSEALLASTTNEEMEGYCLEVTDNEDLTRLGVADDNDQRFILSAIQTLIGAD